jgi:phosphoribosylformylglycinamidine cyclo-ligase
LKKTSITYADSGVNIDRADRAKQRIKYLAHRTFTKGVVSEIGGFGGMYAIDKKKFREPVLVSSVDGVGTKLKLAFMMDLHHTVGGDLVNHCVNDIAVQGAAPLFFMDYLATGTLDPNVAEKIVEGIAEACKHNGCALIGGETAEMPGMYAAGDYDLAGFCVGAVERGEALTGDKVAAGDVILGLASSGVHSNGFSLVRRLAADRDWKLDRPSPIDQDRLLIDALLEPTRIYVRSLLPIVRSGKIAALAHITGGGLLENIPRILPEHLHAEVDADSWEQPRLMAFLQAQGNIEPEEMARTFNCGIGMAVIVAEADSAEAETALKEAGETVVRIGRIVPGERGCTVTGSAGTWSARGAWSATHRG